jgi:predicted alpha/beta superfamily hydrolase
MMAPLCGSAAVLYSFNEGESIQRVRLLGVGEAEYEHRFGILTVKLPDRLPTGYVYTPPGYDAAETYPVLYLLHGIGGNHTEWLGGEPNNVLSNLLALGEAPPMIAVIPNVRAMKDDGYQSDMFSAENIAAFDNFINDLRDDLMPFIKENYSVSDKREETAIAGLSMGGREALFIGVSMPETFGYVGAFCPAPGLMGVNLGFAGQLTPEEMTLPEK